MGVVEGAVAGLDDPAGSLEPLAFPLAPPDGALPRIASGSPGRVGALWGGAAWRGAQPTLKKPFEDIGQITLKPLRLDGVTSLSLNDGSVRVEVLNEDGFHVRGLSEDDATAVTGDSLRHPIPWQERTLGNLPPGRYMLRLHLHNAEAFAITLE